MISVFWFQHLSVHARVTHFVLSEMNDNNGNSSHGIKAIKTKNNNNNSHGIKDNGTKGIIKGQDNKGNSRLKTDMTAAEN